MVAAWQARKNGYPCANAGIRRSAHGLHIDQRSSHEGMPTMEYIRSDARGATFTMAVPDEMDKMQRQRPQPASQEHMIDGASMEFSGQDIITGNLSYSAQ